MSSPGGIPLPDLLPRPEPPAQHTPEGRSDTAARSDSSSDISVLSNPSEASIEVIPGTEVRAAALQHQEGSHQPVAESCGKAGDSRPVIEELEVTSGVTLYSETASLPASPVKRFLAGEEGSGGDSSAYHTPDTSYQEQEAEQGSTPTNSPPPGPPSPTSPIAWNYQDYGRADHRVQLYCELQLFR